MYEYKITNENLDIKSGITDLKNLKLKIPAEVYKTIIEEKTLEINIENGNEFYYIKKLN